MSAKDISEEIVRISSIMSSSTLPIEGTRTTLDKEIEDFLKENPDLHLGGDVDFHQERSHHTKIFGFHKLDLSLQCPIKDVEFTAIRGPHGTIPLRLFYPSSFEGQNGTAGALVYMHGGGYTVGSVDEFENGLRLLAEESGCITIGVEYRLAPEWKFPTQLDEYATVIQWLQNNGGKERGIHPDKVLGGGDSAGGNMTAALALRLKDQGKKNMRGQVLLYPEARLPFTTKAAVENNSGLYLECKSCCTHSVMGS